MKRDNLKKLFQFNVTAVILLTLLSAVLLYHVISVRSAIDEIIDYLDYVKKVEAQVIENIPIYSDFATPQKEKLLRMYLFPDHYKAAKKYGIRPVQSDTELSEKIAQKALISINANSDALFYFYNVQEKYRFLTPPAASCLNIIAKRFQENLNIRSSLPVIKIAVSSAFRPSQYQALLAKKNQNAVPGTSHSCGISFDIFFDDYYICFPEPEGRSYISKIILTKLRKELGFLMGDALRRQFRSILMESLIQLQDEKIIYAILENQQHCYHVTSLMKL